MDGTAVLAIEKLADRAAGKFFFADGQTPEPRGTYWVRKTPDGPLELVKAAVGPRRFKFDTLGGLAAALAQETEPTLVFVGSSGQPPAVTALLGAERRESFVTHLPLTKMAVTYMEIAAERQDVEEVPRDLATWLKANYPESPSELIGLLRKAKWEAQQKGEHTVAGGSEAMGRSVTQKAMFGEDGGELPEEFMVDVPILGETAENRALTKLPLLFRLTFQHEDRTVRLTADQDHWRQTMVAAMDRVYGSVVRLLDQVCTRERLAQIRVYMGEVL